MLYKLPKLFGKAESSNTKRIYVGLRLKNIEKTARSTPVSETRSYKTLKNKRKETIKAQRAPAHEGTEVRVPGKPTLSITVGMWERPKGCATVYGHEVSVNVWKLQGNTVSKNDSAIYIPRKAK